MNIQIIINISQESPLILSLKKITMKSIHSFTSYNDRHIQSNNHRQPRNTDTLKVDHWVTKVVDNCYANVKGANIFFYITKINKNLYCRYFVNKNLWTRGLVSSLWQFNTYYNKFYTKPKTGY